MTFRYETTIRDDWIDYNGHMQDAYYGLVFSHAVDALQDEVGFDADYRARTGCTIYLLEDHTFYLQEVKSGDRVRVDTVVLGCDEKRFHLHMTMSQDGKPVAVGEFMEMHVSQHPKPHGTAMPTEMLERLKAACASETQIAEVKRLSRPISLPR